MSVALPQTVESNDSVLADVPRHVRELLMRHSGVSERHIARSEQTALDLGEQACQTLFTEHPQLPGLIDVLILSTQSPDYLVPSNSCVLHGRLDLADALLRHYLKLDRN